MPERYGYLFGMIIAVVTCAAFFYAGVKYQQVVVTWMVIIQEHEADNE